MTTPLVEGTKYDTGKREWHMLPWKELEEVVKGFEFGKRKYDENNWKKGLAYSRVFDATQRHLMAWFCDREQKASDSGLDHLAHAICNLLFLMWYDNNLEGDWDDRPSGNPPARNNKPMVSEVDLPSV